MTEGEYVLATNLQKMRIVCDLLRDALPSAGLPDARLSEILRMASHARDQLYMNCKTEE